jgi:hypothetical protein
VPPATFDVDALLGSVAALREGGRPPAEVFLASGVGTVGDDDLVVAVRAALRDRPGIVQSWQEWSYDKRWSPGPYLDGLEVGHYDAGRQHVRRHPTEVHACADFVLAEVRWLVERRVVEP